MRSATQEKLLSFLLKAIKPLVHLLLESGIGHREFSEIAKRAFVEVATKEYGIRGRDTNISRVAVMTGLTRKEVKKIREGGYGSLDPDQAVRPVPASTVLSRWFTDPLFLGSNGEPVDLPFLDSDISFGVLVKKYAGDIPPGALRTELLRSGAVVELDGGWLRAVRRDFRVVDDQDRLFRSIEKVLSASVANVANNNIQTAQKKKGWRSWPEYLVEVNNVHPARLEQVADRIREKLFEYASELDSEFSHLDRFVGGTKEEPEGKTATILLTYSERANSANT